MTETPEGGRTAESDAEPQILKLVLELGPLVVFFLANARFGIFWGTGLFIVATLAALIASRLLLGKLPTLPLVSGLFVVVFGGLTVWLQDELFIKMKPTIVNLLFAAILLGGLAMGRALLKLLFGEVFRLSEPGWRLLTFRWACFFVLLAALNEIVWRNTSTDTWVTFKVFGIMPLTMVFAISQLGLLKRYALDSDRRS